MRHLLPRWLGGSRPGAWLLSDYPAFPLPHPGCGKALTPAQAAENLTAFTSSLGARQQALRHWLPAHGGPDPAALTGAAYATALKAWARSHWQRLPPFDRLPAHAPWPDCPRDGAFIVYSLLGDLAASLGEAIRQANHHWRWGLNLDETDLADGMATSRRVVLLADLAEPTPETREAVLDLEAMVFHAHRFPQSVDFIHLDTWTRTVSDAIAGAHYR
jgi:hypothetical protein